MAFKDFVKELIIGSRPESVREFEVSFEDVLSSLKIVGELESFKIDSVSRKVVIRVRSN